MGNPSYPGITSAGFGQINWIDFLIHERAPANTLCYNFACYGATVTRSPGDPPPLQYRTFTDQIQVFQDVKDTAPWNGNNSLFVSWFGVNDIALNTALGFPLESGASSSNGYDGVATPYFDQLEILHDAGARDFMVLLVPPIDRAPVTVGSGYETVQYTLNNITAFNQVLKDKAQVFLNTHADSRLSILDTSLPFNSVLDSPGQYGAGNASCSDSDGHVCLWSNSAHPGVAIHRALGEAAYDRLNSLGFWQGTYSAGPVEAVAQSSASKNLISRSTLWLIIFLAGVATGRFTGRRGKPLRYELKLGYP